MGFTTQTFLFVFFPVCMAAYFLMDAMEKRGGAFFCKIRAKDLILIVFSLGFYAWACFDDVIKLVIYILVVYAAALCLQHIRLEGWYLKLYRDGESGQTERKIHLAGAALTLALLCVIGCLIYYKYSGFLSRIWEQLTGSSAKPKSIVAPLGISFITFSAISYLVDVYRGSTRAGSLMDCMLYLTFFPKVISGPIVLWKDFRPQISGRVRTLDHMVEGINRIMIGFAKKVLLADQFGACLASMSERVDIPTAWGAALLYMLQLYYDFAGYSDIAIGMAQLLGFEFKNNFNFPYRSRSIAEFWRRWHISLGTWFREYVYFPLGGSRTSLTKNLRNLAVVFALTGIWHGAGWNYILWGAINGAFVLFERLTRDKPLIQKTPDVIKWAATMGITMFCWVLFRFSGVSDAVEWVGIMFGVVRFDRIPYTWQYYFDRQILFLMAMAILGATVFGDDRIRAWYRKFSETALGYGIQQIVLLVLFAAAILFMVNSTYSPFIYFQY